MTLTIVTPSEVAGVHKLLDDEADEAQQVVHVCAADVKPEKVEWLWNGRLAVGKLAMLAGRQDGGKSMLTMDIAARISSGRKFPGCEDENPPGDVFLLNGEDTPADTIIPRLINAKADLTRCRIIQGVRRPKIFKDDIWKLGPQQSLNIDDDISRLKALVEQYRPKLIIIDPLACYLGPNVNSHVEADIRRVLAPLERMMDRCRVAVLAVVHLNKKTDVSDPLMRVGGSNALTAAPRLVFLLAPDKDDETRERLVLSQVKNNLGRKAKDKAFRIVDVDGPDTGAAKWEDGEFDSQAFEALKPEMKSKGPVPTQREEAAEFLREYLADGAKESVDVDAEATKRGIKLETLKRAKKIVGVQSRQRSFDDGTRWCCWLPEPEEEQVPSEA